LGNAAQYAVPSAVRANDTVNDTACPTVVSCTHTYDFCPFLPQPVTRSPVNQSYGTTSGAGARGTRLAENTRYMVRPDAPSVALEAARALQP